MGNRAGLIALGLSLGFMAPFASAELAACCRGEDNHLMATTAPSGLGKASPDALDVSMAPDWHAYWFSRGGLRYLQVNGPDGAVRMAIGLVGAQILPLPVGVDSVKQVAVAPLDHLVYRDVRLTVAAQIGLDGSITWLVSVAGP